ncbi:hypothetical protein ATZ36_05540 [Candidatus Endomicrobiellum trichonymphae]|uniref:Uncharacterized protein n=1 Tax=Endomicrobium trichonymphae TaxID=1408204 RepID=A0A1E5IIJ4_ENDTX|nr:hypothetical protein ATZ36_05540 [Candidatus Endomicrobium trichonymphae]
MIQFTSFLHKPKKECLSRKIFDKKNKSGRTLDIDKAKSVFFFRNDDKTGDITVSTPLFREIKKKYLDIEGYNSLRAGNNKEIIIRYNNNVSVGYMKPGESSLRIFLFSENCGNRM